MEDLQSAVDYLKSQLERNGPNANFRICCRWNMGYMIDVAGNVYHRNDDCTHTLIQKPLDRVGIEPQHIQEWVCASQHILALYRLDGKRLPPEIADVLRQAGV